MGDSAAILSSVRWSEDAYYLKEFINKFPLPQVAKVVKGQHMSVGVSTISSPAQHSTIIISKTQRRPGVLAQSVKFKDGKRYNPVGPKLSIPDSYDGYFEILSEDGRSVRSIESISELTKRFPESVLVRENIKAFVSKSDDVETLHEKSRTIHAGEVLILVGEVLGVKGKAQNRYLRCLDHDGENVYLPFELKGRFSVIAKEENISGVHSIHNLKKKRLPLMARLVHGSPPLGNKTASAFLPDLRIFAKMDEELLMAVPLYKDSSAVYLPMSANIKLQPIYNFEYVSGMMEVTRLLERGESQLAASMDRILAWETVTNSHTDRRNAANRKLSLPQETKRNSIYGLIGSNIVRSDSGKSEDYDEIDQIYDYVRGFAPLPKSAKGWQYNIEEEQSEKKDDQPASNIRRESEPELVGGRHTYGRSGQQTGYGTLSRLYGAGKTRQPSACPSLMSPTHTHRTGSPPAVVPPVISVTVGSGSNGQTSPEPVSQTPPEPPPIETIPTRRARANSIAGGHLNSYYRGGGQLGQQPSNNNSGHLSPGAEMTSGDPSAGHPQHMSLGYNRPATAQHTPSVNLHSHPLHTVDSMPLAGQPINDNQTVSTPTANGSAGRIYDRPKELLMGILDKTGSSGGTVSNKKRQRPKTADVRLKNGEHSTTASNNAGGGSTPLYAGHQPHTTNRYIKAAHRQNNTGGTGKHKFFRGRKDKESSGGDKNGGGGAFLTAGNGGLTKDSRSASQQSFFSLRYKSLTNLAQQQQEYDTLDSSNSGGKTSFDSSGSRNVPEKRSRKLSRPKSLTNLVWDFRVGGGGGGRSSSPSNNGGMHRSTSKHSLLVTGGDRTGRIGGDMGNGGGGGFSKTEMIYGRMENCLYGLSGGKGGKKGRELSPGAVARKLGGKNFAATLYL